jgi:hypothetical protein
MPEINTIEQVNGFIRDALDRLSLNDQIEWAVTLVPQPNQRGGIGAALFGSFSMPSGILGQWITKVVTISPVGVTQEAVDGMVTALIEELRANRSQVLLQVTKGNNGHGERSPGLITP